MKYCYHCGKQAPDSDVFCHFCGQRLSEQPPRSAGMPQGQPTQQPPRSAGMPQGQPTAPNPAENPVRYVQIDTRTGKIAEPVKKNHSSAFVQGLIIAIAAVAVVMVMVAGSMFIAGHINEKGESDGADPDSVISFPLPSSEEEEEVSSEPEPVSSEEEEVSSEEDDVPPEQKAEYLKSRLKGKWTTKIPYKSMSLPVTFTFDDQGNCSCVMKALFVTKQFDGKYEIQDGGACKITLIGLEEYMKEGDTLAGNLAFESDDVMTFTVGEEVWKLDRVK